MPPLRRSADRKSSVPTMLVPAWQKPYQDGTDGVKHEGWTFGSVGAVWAETPNRIWVAMRGELPLPMGAKPWTPYGMLGGQMNRGNATGNPDGLSATCEQGHQKRGWERRMHHVIYVLDGKGNMIAALVAVRQGLRSVLRTRAPQDQDEPVRSGEARVGHRRSAARDLQVHVRRQAGA